VIFDEFTKIDSLFLLKILQMLSRSFVVQVSFVNILIEYRSAPCLRFSRGDRKLMYITVFIVTGVKQSLYDQIYCSANESTI